MQKMIKTLAAGLLATTALTSAALAGGSLKDSAAPEGRQFAWSFNIGGTTDYVFRGISQNGEDPAMQGGIDFSYGIFYAGAWASMVDFGTDLATGSDVADAEVDYYAGIKPTWGPLNFDFGVIYYSYPGSINPGGLELDYVELKAGVSASPFDKFTTGLAVFYSPDYTLESGATWTIEGTAAYEFRKIGPIVPTLSGTLGTTLFDSSTDAVNFFGANEDSYLYWNVGMSFAVDKLTFDFRYWDTNLDATNYSLPDLADERFVFSAKVTLP